MKILAIALATLTLTSAAFADIYQNVTGKVIAIEPVLTRVAAAPVKSCHIEHRYVAQSGNAVAGAIVGGAIGNQFGKGDGNIAMTILGAIAGSEVARNNNRMVTEQVEVCELYYPAGSDYIANEYDIYYNVNGQQIVERVNSAVGQRAYIGQRKVFRVNYQAVN
jgi:uncharacterized protein YcfJ